MIFKDKFMITNYTNNGVCSNCGQCCLDFLHLSHREIKDIDGYIKKNKIEATPKSCMAYLDARCPFRDDKNKCCKIYPVRPEICKIFKCDKTPLEAYKNREFNNFKKLPRSMRNLFFKDNENAIILKEEFGIKLFDRDDKIIGGKYE